MTAMELLAPAKINIYLEVKGRRADGYHDIESVMHTVSLFDRITLTSRRDAITFTCSNPALPTDEKNLAVRAALLLKKELGVRAGAHISLEKNIPLGAGLGGGSSDAAAVLKGLLKLWKKKLPDERLNALAASLGADVPFFLRGGTALARGIGEKLTPLPGGRPARFLLVYPGFGVATPWVYRNLHFPLTNKQKITKMKQLLEKGVASDVWGGHLFNRLEEVVFPHYPKIRQLKEMLQKLGCRSLMSGSGATVFGLVSSVEEGERIKSKLKKRYSMIWLVESIQ